MHQDIFELSEDIRYVAIYCDGNLTTRAKHGTAGSSSEESDKYEEILVNPTLLKLATQRGEIDCGGLSYLLIRYGNFFQLVFPMTWGHVSVCIEPSSRPTELAEHIISSVRKVPNPVE